MRFLGKARRTTAFLVGVVAVVCAVFRPLLFASVDERVARSRRVPVRALSVLFMVLLGLVAAPYTRRWEAMQLTEREAQRPT